MPLPSKKLGNTVIHLQPCPLQISFHLSDTGRAPCAGVERRVKQCTRMAVLCRRGLPRGAVSRAFSAGLLLDACKRPDADPIYVELDSAGWLTSAGGGAGAGAGPAALCVRARLAPTALCAGALLSLCPPPPPAPQSPQWRHSPLPQPALAARGEAPVSVSAHLRLHVTDHLAPHAEFLLWFAEDVLAALDMPFLTLQNISGRIDYACHKCGTTFDEPNPLKVHMFLSCAAYEPEHFWRRVVARLRPAEYAAPGLAPSLAPAALEALATEWGRARGGHVCVYCGKLYSRRYGLKIHLRTHTGYRPLRCRHCRRPFGDPSNLNKHERLHAARGRAPTSGPAPGAAPGPAPGPYWCAQCGRALARRRDLERHMRTHARDKQHDTFSDTFSDTLSDALCDTRSETRDLK
ncbi:hypothetical protein SFRURICE_015206 [Spodoptera frugiperda]|nr:hypothetical protein SFRURICE_015206 [Spodoptera frugiperda]